MTYPFSSTKAGWHFPVPRTVIRVIIIFVSPSSLVALDDSDIRRHLLKKGKKKIARSQTFFSFPYLSMT